MGKWAIASSGWALLGAALFATQLLAVSTIANEPDDDDAPAAAPKAAHGPLPAGQPGEAAPIMTARASGPITITLGAEDQTAICRASFRDGPAPLALEKVGKGKITLLGPGAHTGGTSIKDGVLALGNDGDSSGDATALGTGLVTIGDGATLRLGGSTAGGSQEIIPNNVQIDHGVIYSYAGHQRFTGRVTVEGGGATFVTHTKGGDISFDGDITGAGPLEIDSDASGTGGMVRMTNDLSLMGTVTINGPSPGFGGGMISLEDPDALNQATLVTNAGMRGVYFAPKKKPFTIGAITGSGGIDLNGNRLWVGGIGTDFLYTGTLSDSPGDGEFVKVGKGVMTLAGAQRLEGRLSVYSGVLLITAAIPGEVKIGNPTVPLADAKLMGTGPVGNILLQTAGAVVQPGESAGVPGVLYAKNFSMTPGSTLEVRLESALPAAEAEHKQGGYDQIRATGQFSLSGNLHVTLLAGFHASPGDAFYILATTGSAPALGHFSNVVSDEIAVEGHRFAINYTADAARNDPQSKSGHDVALITLGNSQ